MDSSNNVLIEIVKTHPSWVVVMVLLCFLIWKVSPSYFDKKNCETRCNELSKKVDTMQQTIDKLKTENTNYNQLKGAVIVMRKLLIENGYDDIPGLD